MFAKSLLAAAAVAAGLVAVQPQTAAAKANVDINVYLPGVGMGYPGYHGPAYGFPVFAPRKMSCFQGKQSLRWKGFRQVDAFDCTGRLYGYTARRHGKFFRVRLNSFSGQVVSLRKI
jgi:hypothetical protein